jgi:hypothetical protein
VRSGGRGQERCGGDGGQVVALADEELGVFHERRLRGHGGAVLVDPHAEVVEHGAGLALAARAPRLGVVAGERGSALDREEASNLPNAFERDCVARARGLDEAPATVGLIRSAA